ncbi:MAG: hypothetical protein DHS20C15_07190 [Planctomycetota bacterium]|nr:MAG: hypothetical protein DHS20C15_07190 [Planctomycetota bacterium]
MAVVFLTLLVGYGLLAAQLVRLQVVEHEMWSRESLRSTMRYRSLPFERGWILDRHGEPMARTEEVADLVFVYRDWRRESVAGALSAAERARHGDVLSVIEAIDFGDALLSRFESTRLSDIAALEPRARRADFLFYVGALFGKDFEQAALIGLREGGAALEQTLGELPAFAAARQRLVARQQLERAALPDLARVLDMPLDELLEGMEASRQRADRDVRDQVAELMSKRKANAVTEFASGAGTAVASEREPEAAAARTPPTPEQYRAFVDTREGYAVADAARRQFDGRARRLAANIPHDTQTLVTLRSRAFPGFELSPQQRRVYPSHRGREVAPLLLGDVGAPSGDMRLIEGVDKNPLEIANLNASRLVDLVSLADPSDAEMREIAELRLAVRELDYRPDEETGRRGLERVLEPVLRGKRGWIASRRDTEGRTEEHREPQRGLNVTLTLDLALQAAAEEVLDEVFVQPPRDDSAQAHWTGAIVVMDPRTGEVLTLASGPRAPRARYHADYNQLAADEFAPLRHRALRPGGSGNLPPPGSVFKPVTALAWRGFARATGEPDLSPEHWCGMTLSLGTQSMRCLGSHGNIGLQSAMARSCNIYFYELGREMGVGPLFDMAARFGFGESSHLVIGNERLLAAGVPLDPSAKLDGVRDDVPPIQPGRGSVFEAMRLSIGQSPLDDVTPLQVATMMAALGTGQLRPPSLIRHVEGYPDLPAVTPRNLGLHPGDLDEIKAGMRAVVESPVGTAHELMKLFESAPFDALSGHVAAKTGTAEVANRPDHAWFAGFFPAEAPRVAFAVLVEEIGLHGGEGAVPVFEMFLRKPAVTAWLERDVLDNSRTAQR